MAHDRRYELAGLRRSIDRLPRRTREAMLAGIERENAVITGAYADRSSGVCPMMAAHRTGVRVDCMSFPDAWDRFTGVYGRGICRPATSGELRILVAQLHDSLKTEPLSDLAVAIAEHQAAVSARRAAAPDVVATVDHEIKTRQAAETARAAAARREARAARRIETGREVESDAPDLGAAIADHEALVSARRERMAAELRAQELDLAAAIAEHQASARARRAREAAQVGMDWMSDYGFGTEPRPDTPPTLPSRRRRRELTSA